MHKKNVFFSPSESPDPTRGLAIEHLDTSLGSSQHSGTHREYTQWGCRISHALLCDGYSYHTLITGQPWLLPPSERICFRRALQKILLHYLEKADFCLRSGRVLFCGLGNEKLTADALGPMTADGLYAAGGDPIFRTAGFTELYVLKPGVPSQSGIKTGVHIASVASRLSADLIITADAAAAKTVQRLASVIQVTDRGVWAGAGAGDHADEISSRTMPCPVISISVPTVIRASLLGEGEESPAPKREDFLVSLSETDLICQCYAELISGAANRIFSLPLCEEEHEE